MRREISCVFACPIDCQIALCSLSTGRSDTPRSRTRGMMICPAQTMSSLFAKRDGFAGQDRLIGRFQRRVTGTGDDHDIDIAGCVTASISAASPQSYRVPGRWRGSAVPGALCTASNGEKRSIWSREQLEVVAGRDGHQIEPIGKLTQDIERLGADRAGRPNQRDPGARLVTGATGTAHSSQQSNASARNHPATNVKMSASIRSRKPPCPGIRSLLSFTPASRLSTDSARSP